MEITILTKYISNEKKAEEFLREKGLLKTFTQYPYCGNNRMGRMRRKNYKYYACKKNGA